MFCTKCGTKLEKNNLFCTSCGARQDGAGTSKPEVEQKPIHKPEKDKKTEQMQTKRDRKPKRVPDNKPAKNNKLLVFIAILLLVLIILLTVVIYLLKTRPNDNEQEASLPDPTPVTTEDERPIREPKPAPEPIREPEPVPEPAPTPAPEELVPETPAVEMPDPIATLDEALIIAKRYYPEYSDWSQGEWASGIYGEDCAIFMATSQEQKAYYAVFVLVDGTDCYARYAGEIQEYIIPNSNKFYLTEEDLKYLSKEELRLARNEIYARHGRMFVSQDLQDYFNAKPWYSPQIPADKFNDNILSEVERYNANFIREYEDKIN